LKILDRLLILMMKMLVLPGHKMDKPLIQEIGQRLADARRILVVSHVRPDGDAIGSLLGIGLALLESGKDIQMALGDGVPASLRHLTGSDKIVRQVEGDFDLTVVVDCSDIERVGNVLEGRGKPDINIDHHITNLHFAVLNLVEVTAVATSEILAQVLPGWGFSLPQGSVDALLTGILTDTIGFRTSNMSARVLRIAADLVDAGGNLPELYWKALLQKSFNAARLWGSGLSNLQREGKIVWTTLTLADRKKAEYPGSDDADLINMLSFLSETEVALIFTEQPGKKVKVSWRAQSDKDVSQVALRFGGGGHKAAAGAEVSGSLDEVQQRVLEATRNLF
jgi:phosphoesterase RecJ-like protein